MDLISRKSVIDRLTSLLEDFRSDTHSGQCCRDGVRASIRAVQCNNFTLGYLGYSELNTLKQDIVIKMKELEPEETISIYSINGLYSMRYTQDPDKAKAIFLEEANRINQDDGLNDFLDETLKVSIKKVRKSDLASYVFE